MIVAMKANQYQRIAAGLFFLGIFSLLTINQASGATTASHNLNGWNGNANFWFSNEGNSVKVEINKKPWESFCYRLSNHELLQNPLLAIQIQSNEKINLRIDVSDGQSISSVQGIVETVVTASSSFQNYVFDFSDLLSSLSFNSDLYLLFYVNSGKEFKGSLRIMEFETTEKEKNTIPAETYSLTLPSVFPNPANAELNLSFPAGIYSEIVISDVNGKIVERRDVSSEKECSLLLDISDKASGNYVVSFAGNSGKFSSALMIE
jgi:hypothetical protein